MRKVVSLLILLLVSYALSAQIVIQGSVRDEEGVAIAGVVVSLQQQGKTLSYGTTGNDGRYRLNVQAGGDTATVIFNHLTFEKLEVPTTFRSRNLDVILRERSETLKEVTVTAPVVKLRGDTLSFWLPALAAREDYTLEDAMKRIPGIEVDESGRISYQGRAISHFYIDGVDILGGKYTLATRGISAKMVDQVEILDNHHSVKMERNTGRTNEVAMNIKLNKEARIKPTGSSEARAGWGSEGFLGRIGGSLMRFGGKDQAILAAKLGNDAQFAQSETSDYFSSNQISGKASTLAGSVSGSSAPLDARYYLRPMDAYVSLDASHKQSEDVRLRLNSHYAYSYGTYDYSTRSDYYAGDNVVTLKEVFNPSSKLHVPSIGLDYQLNSAERYLNERFRATANFVTNTMATMRDDNLLDQRSSIRAIRLQNSLDWRKLLGDRRIYFNNTIAWTSSPSVQYSFAGLGLAGQQDGFSHNLSVNQRISTAHDWRRLTLDLPLNATIDYDRIGNTLVFGDIKAQGSLTGFNGAMLFSPLLRWRSPSKQLQIDLRVALGGKGLSVRDRFTGNIDKCFLPILDPNLSLDWTATARSQFRLTASSRRTVGDIMDFLRTPVMSSYRSIRQNPGILRDGRNSRISLDYDWKRPIELWFFHSDITASRNKTNLRSSQMVETDQIWITSIPEPVSSDGLTFSGSLSKRFQQTSTKLMVGIRAGSNRNSITQQGRAINYKGDNMRLNWEASTAPLKWISLSYKGYWSRNGSSYLGNRTAFVTQTHAGTLSVFPVTALRVYFDTDFIRTQIAGDLFKNMALGQAGIEWNKNKVRYKLLVHNIFDTRNYAYSIFTGLDTFSYDYALRGREILFSITYTI